jgi:hypothetical protein
MLSHGYGCSYQLRRRSLQMMSTTSRKPATTRTPITPINNIYNEANTSQKINYVRSEDYDIINRSKNYIKQKNEKSSIFQGLTSDLETYNGRVAMMLFTGGIVNEIFSGKSLLEQLGFTNRDAQEIFIFFLVTIPLAYFATHVVKRFN